MGAYIIGLAIGSNWIMILCVIIGIIAAKKGKACWIVYGVGAALSAISIFGNINSESQLYGQISVFSTAQLFCFIIIAILGAVLIVWRRGKNTASPENIEDNGTAANEYTDNPDPAIESVFICPKCGGTFTSRDKKMCSQCGVPALYSGYSDAMWSGLNGQEKQEIIGQIKRIR